MIYHGNIDKLTLKNKEYRKIIHTTDMMQLVVMCLKPRINIPFEMHEGHDQFIKVVQGSGKICTSRTAHGPRETIILKDGVSVLIPAGVYHEVVNTSRTKDLRLYTIYSPPEHPV